MISDHWFAIGAVIAFLLGVCVIGLVVKQQKPAKSLKQLIAKSKIRHAKIRQSKIDTEIEKLSAILDAKQREKKTLAQLSESWQRRIRPQSANSSHSKNENSISGWSRTRRRDRSLHRSQVRLAGLDSSSEEETKLRQSRRRSKSINRANREISSPSRFHQTLSIDTQHFHHHDRNKGDIRSMRSLSASPTVERQQRHLTIARPQTSQGLQRSQPSQSLAATSPLPLPSTASLETSVELSASPQFDHRLLSSPSPLHNDSFALSPSPISQSMKIHEDSMPEFDLNFTIPITQAPSLSRSVSARPWTRGDSRSLMQSENIKSFELFVNRKKQIQRTEQTSHSHNHGQNQNFSHPHSKHRNHSHSINHSHDDER